MKNEKKLWVAMRTAENAVYPVAVYATEDEAKEAVEKGKRATAELERLRKEFVGETPVCIDCSGRRHDEFTYPTQDGRFFFTSAEAAAWHDRACEFDHNNEFATLRFQSSQELYMPAANCLTNDNNPDLL